MNSARRASNCELWTCAQRGGEAPTPGRKYGDAPQNGSKNATKRIPAAAAYSGKRGRCPRMDCRRRARARNEWDDRGFLRGGHVLRRAHHRSRRVRARSRSSSMRLSSTTNTRRAIHKSSETARIVVSRKVGQRYVKAVVALAAIFQVGSGAWAFFAPSFYDVIATFPPYNVHFLHDIGAFLIGIGVSLAGALLWRDALFVVLLGAGVAASVHWVSMFSTVTGVARRAIRGPWVCSHCFWWWRWCCGGHCEAVPDPALTKMHARKSAMRGVGHRRHGSARPAVGSVLGWPGRGQSVEPPPGGPARVCQGRFGYGGGAWQPPSTAWTSLRTVVRLPRITDGRSVTSTGPDGYSRRPAASSPMSCTYRSSVWIGSLWATTGPSWRPKISSAALGCRGLCCDPPVSRPCAHVRDVVDQGAVRTGTTRLPEPARRCG